MSASEFDVRKARGRLLELLLKLPGFEKQLAGDALAFFQRGLGGHIQIAGALDLHQVRHASEQRLDRAGRQGGEGLVEGAALGHHQRPARGCSSKRMGRVQGSQPMLA